LYVRLVDFVYHSTLDWRVITRREREEYRVEFGEGEEEWVDGSGLHLALPVHGQRSHALLEILEINTRMEC